MIADACNVTIEGAAARPLTADDVVVVNDHGTFGINIHHSYFSDVQNPEVYNFSEGCQVFHKHSDYQQLRRLYTLSKRGRCQTT